MEIVVKMVIDHELLGDVFVALYEIPKRYMNSYPVADDPNHVITPKQKTLPKSSSPPKIKRGGLRDAVLAAINTTPTPLADIIQNSGASKGSVYTMLTKLVQEHAIKRVDKGVYKKKEASHG